jgi:microcystin degradation protein MlrC
MRVFIAGLVHETNTFAPFPTGLQSYAQGGIYHGDGSKAHTLMSPVLSLWRKRSEELGGCVVESLLAGAEPSGPTLKHVYEAFRQEILRDLETHGPMDMILLSLHGAMVAHGYDDCEGDLIQAIRAVVGPKCILGAELDLHCHLTRTMVEGADALVTYRYYPHTDIVARAEQLFSICHDALTGKVKPVSAVFDCAMTGLYPTSAEPMASLVARLCELERREGILSASLCHGFPWADVAEIGTKVLVIADADAKLASRTAEEFGLEFYRHREALAPQMHSIDEALNIARLETGPVVLAETSDNAGGGAPGDNTLLLRVIIERAISNVASGCFWDPLAVGTCADAGEGARFMLRLGGKVGKASADPLDLEVTVMRVVERHTQSGLTGPVDLGRSAWVRTGNDIDIVITSVRTQTLAPDAFTGIGVSLDGKHLVTVKSIEHFRAQFAPYARKILRVMSAGALDMNFAALPYTKRSGNYWPRVADPLEVVLHRNDRTSALRRRVTIGPT